jgi:hypothetical protein
MNPKPFSVNFLIVPSAITSLPQETCAAMFETTSSNVAAAIAADCSGGI